MILIDGKKEAAKLREDLKKEVTKLKKKYNKIPGLTVILIGDLTPSQIYVKNKEKSAKEVGLKSMPFTDKDASLFRDSSHVSLTDLLNEM